TGRNMFSGRLQVRFRDAHSWTEGYFEGLGWLNFDATPGPPPGSQRSDFLDMLEELDFAWYSHIVNFNGFAQRDLALGSLRFLEKIPASFWTLSGPAVFLVVLLIAAYRHARNISWRWPGKRHRSGLSSARIARHHYDEMLQAFGKGGIVKTADQTPLEFLTHLRADPLNRYDDAALLTDHFCKAFYGQKPLSRGEEAATQQALDRIKLKATQAHAAAHHAERI
ncbi:MAG TPA: DUF4129 domain-containing protein, partial [Verrucomicrobiae bacterium]|nr:DUF4129 domain-containing protein [Verrucomicrobiae bacterium]